MVAAQLADQGLNLGVQLPWAVVRAVGTAAVSGTSDAPVPDLLRAVVFTLRAPGLMFVELSVIDQRYHAVMEVLSAWSPVVEVAERYGGAPQDRVDLDAPATAPTAFSPEASVLHCHRKQTIKVGFRIVLLCFPEKSESSGRYVVELAGFDSRQEFQPLVIAKHNAAGGRS